MYSVFNVYCKNYIKYLDGHFSKGTIYTKQYMINKYIVGNIPNINIVKIDYNCLYLWYQSLNDNLIISVYYKNRILSLFKTLFDFISISTNLNFNFVKLFLPFKDLEIKPINLEDEKKYLPIENFKNIYNSVDSSYWKLYLLLSYCLGIRIGEIRAIKCNSLSLSQEHKALIVYYQLIYVGEGKSVPAVCKSKDSTRVYYLPDFLYEAIEKHIIENELSDTDFLFFSPRGKDKPIGSTSIRRFLKSLDSSMHPHMFRHSTGTEFLSNGINIEEIKDYLGHSSSRTTEKYYIHKTKKEIENVNNVLTILYDFIENK